MYFSDFRQHCRFEISKLKLFEVKKWVLLCVNKFVKVKGVILCICPMLRGENSKNKKIDDTLVSP